MEVSPPEAQFSFRWTPDLQTLALAPWTPAGPSSPEPGVATGQLQRLGGDRLLVRFTALDGDVWEAVIEWLEEWACEDGWSLSYADGLQVDLPLRGGGPMLRCTSCRRFERPNWISAGPVFGLWRRPRTRCRTCGLGHALPVRSKKPRH